MDDIWYIFPHGKDGTGFISNWTEEPKKTEYVVGFVFSGDNMLLIRKNKPAWQRGRLNGLGGHIEATESPVAAMVREFHEEAGVFIESGLWRHVANLNWPSFKVHVFTVDIDEELAHYVSCGETREGDVQWWNELDGTEVSNLRWLIPMCKNVGEFEKPVEVHYTK